jgi:hypothetical protein
MAMLSAGMDQIWALVVRSGDFVRNVLPDYIRESLTGAPGDDMIINRKFYLSDFIKVSR